MSWMGRLDILSAGARTSLGADLAASLAAAEAGLCQFGDHPYMVDERGFPMVVARDPWIAPEASRTTRLATMAAAAALDCLASTPSRPGRRRLGLWLALPDDSQGVEAAEPEEIAQAVARAVQHHAEIAEVTTIKGCHASGMAALWACAAACVNGTDAEALLIGADTWVDALTLEWLDERELMRTEKRPFGFLPGEAAMALHLARGGQHRQVRASIEGLALAREEHLGPAEPRLGTALTRAARDALAVSAESVRPVQALYADLNGEPGRADEVGYTTVRVRESLDSGHSLRVPAECFGDVGAATVPLMAAMALARARGPGQTESSAMLLAQSADGLRGAAVLSLPQRENVR